MAGGSRGPDPSCTPRSQPRKNRSFFDRLTPHPVLAGWLVHVLAGWLTPVLAGWLAPAALSAACTGFYCPSLLSR